MRLAPVLITILASASAEAPRFYPDDPLLAEPRRRDASKVVSRKLSDYYDLFSHQFFGVGDRNTPLKKTPAQGVNTLGEPYDDAWWVPRHYYKKMSLQELAEGPAAPDGAPAPGKWTVTKAKTEGITPGFTILDSRKRRYFLKFDPMGWPEQTTAADVISSKFFWALGYWVPANYIAEFDVNDLILGEDVEIVDKKGPRKMTRRDLIEVLMRAPRGPGGKYRVVASLQIEGKPVGPRRFYGTRSDDPNDIFPHEHRRDLRGAGVASAWVDHDDSRAINSFDTLVEQGGVRFIRHYWIDFGSTLGSASWGPNSPRSGDYFFTWRSVGYQLITLGLDPPYWSRAKYPDYKAVGRFESKVFDPEKWVPEYPNPAFLNALPDDQFWAAKQIMAFTNAEIAAIVSSGKITEPGAAEWITRCLIERRDKIGKAYLTKVLPVDRFAVSGGSLVFEDLGEKHNLASGPIAIQWSRFNNDLRVRKPLAGRTGAALPAELRASPPGNYFAAELTRGTQSAIVFLRTASAGVEVVGIDRPW